MVQKPVTGKVVQILLPSLKLCGNNDITITIVLIIFSYQTGLIFFTKLTKTFKNMKPNLFLVKCLKTFWQQYLSVFCIISSTFWKLFINGPLTFSCICSNKLMVYLTDFLRVTKSLWFNCKLNDKTSHSKQIYMIVCCSKSWSRIPINSALW